MRQLFWILLLANVLLFAAMQRGWLGWGEQDPQAQPALHGEMIRLLDTAQSVSAKIPAAPAVAPAHLSVPVSAPVPVGTPRVAPSNLQMTLSMSAPASSNTALTCLEWGDFSGPDLARSAAALSAMHLGDRLS